MRTSEMIEEFAEEPDSQLADLKSGSKAESI